MRILSLLLTLALVSTAAAQQELRPKQVAAPAADILNGLLRLPAPKSVANASRAAIFEPGFELGAQGRFEARVKLPLSRGLVTLTSLTAGPCEVQLFDTTQEPRRLDLDGSLQRAEFLQSPLDALYAQRFVFEATPADQAVLVLSTDFDPGPSWLVLADENELVARAWLADWERTNERPLTVLAEFDDAGFGSVLESAWLDLSSGSSVVLHDDGLHADGEAADGLFGGSLPAGHSGALRGRVELRGVSPAGPVRRSVPLAFTLHEPVASLIGAASSEVLDQTRLALELAAIPLGEARKLQLSVEVWGCDLQGASVPICWLSRMIQPRVEGPLWKLDLELDGRWLDHAGARPPLELRALRLQDPDTHGVLDALDFLPLEVNELPPIVGHAGREVTREMLMGSSMSIGPQTYIGPSTYSPALMLVHGYCSSGTPWPNAQFSAPKRSFFDPDANRSHDQFAQLIAQQASGLSSFGIAAHSQGGSAALHLYTYYNSPLDLASGGRRIQSLATPYQGTPLAAFGGLACGVNDNMTPSGSAAWLAGIPSWARAEVWYWTVSDAGTPCSALTNLFLSDPEDGTIEVARGQLVGGNSMGNKIGWCHTTGMSYPACTTDSLRNAEIDAEAAR